MKTIYSIIYIVIIIGVTGRTNAQEKASYWSIGHYLKPSITQPMHKLGMRNVQSGGNISTNNLIYPSTNPQTEISAAININNPNQIMVAANTVLGGLGQGWYATTDGGFSWYGSDYYPNGSQNLGDPVIICDDSSHFFDISMGFDGQNPHGIIITKTTDAGQSWKNTITSVDPTYSTGVDKPMAVADNNSSSPYKGNLYAAWTDFATNPHSVVFSKSTDRGTHWSSSLKTLNNTTTFGQGTSLAVGPNGEVYVAWANYPNGNLPATGMGFVFSTDSGHTFSTFNGSSVFSFTGIRYTNYAEHEFGGIGVNDFPCIDVDKSNGNYRGYIYAVVAVNTGSDTVDSDIKFARSTDGGATWQTGFTNGTGYVNINRSKEQFFPWMSVDDITGRISVTYYSQDTAGYAVNTYVAISDDGGTTFQEYKVSDVSHTPVALGGSYRDGYSGDYINVSSHNSKVYPFWMDNRSGSLEYQAYFSYSIYSVNQKLANNSTFGTVKKWNGSIFNSVGTLPATINDPNFTNEALQGQQDINSGQKYNAWYLNLDKVSDVTNHHLFSIPPGTPAFVSQYNPTYTGTTIKNVLEGTSVNGGNVQFKDPWFIDYSDPSYGYILRNRSMSAVFNQRQSPFYPDYSTNYGINTYKGVFLNQPYTGTNPVYYSIQALPTQTINLGGSIGTRTFYFLNWTATGANFQNSNSNQTAVVFTSSSALVKANLKGHLLSNITSATTNNNQRALVLDQYGVYHLAYASMGEIWYTRSTDGGTTWSQEIRLSAGSGTAHNPSITDQGNYSNNLFVLWVDNSNYPATGYSIYGKKLFTSSWQWEPTRDISGYDPLTYVGYAKQNAKPVGITYGYQGQMYCLVAYENNSWNYVSLRFGHIDPNLNNDTWSSGGIPSIASSTVNPSMYYDPYHNKIYVVFDNSTNVYMAYWDKQYSPTSPNFSTPYTVSDGSIASPNSNPTVTADYTGRVLFAWKGFDHTQYYKNVILSRSLSWQGFSWSPVTEFVYYNPFDQPTICGHSDSNGGASLLFHSSNNYVYKVKSSDGVNWNGGPGNPGVTIGTNSYSPNALDFSNPASVSYVWTTSSSAPYAIPFQKYNENTNMIGKIIASDANDSSLKKAYFDFSQSYLLTKSDKENYFVQFKDLTLTDLIDNSKVPIKLFGNLSNISSLNLRTTEGSLFNLQAGKYRLSGSLRFFGSNANTNIKIILSDSSNTVNQQLGKLIIDNNNQLDSTIFSVPLSLNNSKGLNISFQINGKVDTSFNSTLINTYFLTDSLSSMQKQVANSFVEKTPAEYLLSQNYPNPFNPTTVIHYEIPYDGLVTLKIYDLLGREVATLVNEYETSGRYNIKFNAGNLSSGVYIYQLKANDVAGGNGYTATKKLMLLK